MRPIRAVLLVAATALVPALVLTSPASAAGSPAASAIVADAAGTPADDVPVDDMSEDDLRIAILRILADENSGRGVAREATKALNDGSPEAMRAFIETGYRLAQAEDDRVATARILHKATQNGDRAVIREANRTLDTNTPEALRAFIETGYRLAQAEDDRVAVARILADPTISAALRAAAEEVIDGTPDELRYFVVTGQYEIDG